jgi:hypothetical protein
MNVFVKPTDSVNRLTTFLPTARNQIAIPNQQPKNSLLSGW